MDYHLIFFGSRVVFFSLENKIVPKVTSCVTQWGNAKFIRCVVVMETIASCEQWFEKGSWRRMFMEGLSWVILGRVFREELSLGLSRVYGLIIWIWAPWGKSPTTIGWARCQSWQVSSLVGSLCYFQEQAVKWPLLLSVLLNIGQRTLGFGTQLRMYLFCDLWEEKLNQSERYRLRGPDFPDE